MKLTAKQLRQIISEEAGRLDEMFTPAGGIGFGSIPRPGRRSYLDLPIMGETDEVNETESDLRDQPNVRTLDPATEFALKAPAQFEKIEKEMTVLRAMIDKLVAK